MEHQNRNLGDCLAVNGINNVRITPRKDLARKPKPTAFQLQALRHIRAPKRHMLTSSKKKSEEHQESSDNESPKIIFVTDLNHCQECLQDPNMRRLRLSGLTSLRTDSDMIESTVFDDSSCFEACSD